MGFFTKRSRTSFTRDKEGDVVDTEYFDDDDIDTKAMKPENRWKKSETDFDELEDPYPIKKGHEGRKRGELSDDDIKEFEKLEKEKKKKAKLEKEKEKKEKLISKRKGIQEQIKSKTELVKAKAGLRKAKTDLWGARRANISESFKTISEPMTSLKKNLDVMGKKMRERGSSMEDMGEGIASGISMDSESKGGFFDFSLGRKGEISSTQKGGGIEFGSNIGNGIDIGAKGGGMFDFSSKKEGMFNFGFGDKGKFDFSLGSNRSTESVNKSKKKIKKPSQQVPTIKEYMQAGSGSKFSSEVIKKPSKKSKKKSGGSKSNSFKFVLPIGNSKI